MRYLLDVNALLAYGFADHQFHSRVTRWIHSENSPELLTCSITELGFIRILSQLRASNYTTAQARNLLLAQKSDQNLPLTLIPDNNDISHLPAWAAAPKQTTDGHLLSLAKTHNALLATLDSGIPGAFLIP